MTRSRIEDLNQETILSGTNALQLSTNDALQVELKPSLANLRLKKSLKSILIMQPSDWNLFFEIICNVRNYVIKVVLERKKDNKPYAIYYASHTLDEAQINYAIIEKELLTIVFTFDKFKLYLIGSKVIVYTGHTALKYLLNKKDGNL